MRVTFTSEWIETLYHLHELLRLANGGSHGWDYWEQEHELPSEVFSAWDNLRGRTDEFFPFSLETSLSGEEVLLVRDALRALGYALRDHLHSEWMSEARRKKVWTNSEPFALAKELVMRPAGSEDTAWE